MDDLRLGSSTSYAPSTESETEYRFGRPRKDHYQRHRQYWSQNSDEALKLTAEIRSRVRNRDDVRVVRDPTPKDIKRSSIKVWDQRFTAEELNEISIAEQIKGDEFNKVPIKKVYRGEWMPGTPVLKLTLKEPLTVFRMHRRDAKTKRSDVTREWVLSHDPRTSYSKNEVVDGLALPSLAPDYNYLSHLTLPVGTMILIGIAGPQMWETTGVPQSGGIYQIKIVSALDEAWVEKDSQEFIGENQWERNNHAIQKE